MSQSDKDRSLYLRLMAAASSGDNVMSMNILLREAAAALSSCADTINAAGQDATQRGNGSLVDLAPAPAAPDEGPTPRTETMWRGVKHAIDSVDAVHICESFRQIERELAEARLEVERQIAFAADRMDRVTALESLSASAERLPAALVDLWAKGDASVGQGNEILVVHMTLEQHDFWSECYHYFREHGFALSATTRGQND